MANCETATSRACSLVTRSEPPAAIVHVQTRSVMYKTWLHMQQKSVIGVDGNGWAATALRFENEPATEAIRLEWGLVKNQIPGSTH